MSKSLDFFHLQALFIQTDLSKIISELKTPGIKASQIKFLTKKKLIAEKELDRLDLEFKQYCLDLKNSKPTSITNEYWLQVKNPILNRETLNPKYFGKWVIIRPTDELDELWLKIKELTEKNELGISAKASTMKPNPRYSDKEKVICVYTSDYRKTDELNQIRKKLYNIGIIESIGYKTDQSTKAGIYNSSDEFLLKS